MSSSWLARGSVALVVGAVCVLAWGARGAGAAPPSAGQREPVPAPVLDGVTWVLTRIGEESIGAGGREAHLVFRKADGQVAGSTGCNRLSGRYQQDGSKLTVGSLMTTRMACPGEPVIEPRFLAALERVTTCKVAGRQLELFDRDGALLARFEGRALR